MEKDSGTVEYSRKIEFAGSETRTVSEVELVCVFRDGCVFGVVPGISRRIKDWFQGVYLELFSIDECSQGAIRKELFPDEGEGVVIGLHEGCFWVRK